MSPSLTSNSSNKRIRLKKPMFSLMSIPNKYCTGQCLSLITKTSLILTHNSFQSITISNMLCQSLVSSLSLPLIICSSRIVAKHPNWLVPPQTNEFFCTRTLQVKQNYGKGGRLEAKRLVGLRLARGYSGTVCLCFILYWEAGAVIWKCWLNCIDTNICQGNPQYSHQTVQNLSAEERISISIWLKKTWKCSITVMFGMNNDILIALILVRAVIFLKIVTTVI